MSLVLSLFPGADLLGMAFEAEEFCVVAGPDVIFGRDIRGWHPPAGHFDGIIGGPPCQLFSPLVHLVRAHGHEPRHGNLIPEFECCVAEAEPTWFLMEEVPQAPEPVVLGYSVHSFILHNTSIVSEDSGGFGQAQRRKRRFSFGVRGGPAVDLRRWIEYAALELPESSASDYDHGARSPIQHTASADDGGWKNGSEYRRAQALAVTADPRAVPVAIGGSGKVKARAMIARAREAAAGISPEKDERRRAAGQSLLTGSVRARSWAECCELQGLPATFLDDAPFTKAGKFQMLGNGVPLPMGRAIARAVRRALA